jgi:hypothetical protein
MSGMERHKIASEAAAVTYYETFGHVRQASAMLDIIDKIETKENELRDNLRDFLRTVGQFSDAEINVMGLPTLIWLGETRDKLTAMDADLDDLAGLKRFPGLDTDTERDSHEALAQFRGERHADL